MSTTIRHRLAVAVFAMVAATAAQASFTRVTANAGEVRDFLPINATTMFAASQGGGLWKTTDTGANWTWVSTFGARYVWKLAQSPAAAARIYAATETGIWRSADTGATWVQLTFDPTRTLALSPGSTAGADTLIAGVTGNGLIKSTDNGTTWTKVGTAANLYNASGLDPMGVAYASATEVYSVFYCNRYDFRSFNIEIFGGVFKSADGGATWSSIQTLGAVTIPTKCVTSLLVSNTTVPSGVTVLVGTRDINEDGRIYRSLSGGQWSNPASAPDGWYFGIMSFAVDKNSVNTFWSGTRTFGVLKSTTAGQAGGWTEAYTGTDPDMHSEILAIGTFPGNTTVVVGLKGLGIMRSPNGASPWSPALGFAGDRVRGLANHPNVAANTYYMGLARGGFVKSTDAGLNWTQLNTGLIDGNLDLIQSATSVAAHPSSSTIVYGVIRPQADRRGGVYSLNTGTSTWSAAFVGPSNGLYDHATSSLAIKSDGTTFYAGFNAGTAGGGLYKGASAAGLASVGYPLSILEAPPVAPGSYRVRQSAGNTNLVFLLMYDSLPYRSINGGTAWARVTAGEASASFMRTAFFEIAEKPGTGGATLVASSNKGIHQSVDSGANWTRIAGTGLAQTGLQAMAYSTNGILWVGDRAGGVYCSANDGVSFTSASLTGLPPAAMMEAVLMNSQVHFLTDGGGVYKNLTSTVCP